MVDINNIILKYYSEQTELHKLLINHSRCVAEKSLAIVRKHPELQANKQFIYEAAMLHDIGIFMCNAPSIQCFGTHKYIEHGYLGAELIRKEGLEKHALVCERHTGVGLSLDAIIKNNLPIPQRDMLPVSIEEQIICYADKFYSKSKPDSILPIDKILKQLKMHDDKNPEVFLRWHKLFE